jgi:hypothetical protein
MVMRESQCPICGRTYAAAVTRQVLRWGLIVLFAGLLVWRFVL